ncbi:DUF1501 domain-containing protein [Maribacter sp. MJ134]|uniref:DUF1501 domain-containing protein n=1 Tax=Maribacter sp. MJ134 TaxID=2496865 RepID=UPI000F82DDA7|nr:DUF1501 domain-containing protein [Maribacter sp. MJ134]AZQ59150.1 DUF1501 domain-containing protein [Maribacter sp. MJ134]
MKRRDFIQQSSLATSLLMVPNFIKAFEGSILNERSFKKLVIVQLSGGNDGLNTIVPYTNDVYYKSRPKIAIKASEVRPINNTLGFHPGLLPMQRLYDKGYLSIINNVGYPNPSRSHFRATDIWHTASDSNDYLTSGWIGRFIEQNGKKPFSAIEIDDSLSLMLKGREINGIATKNPKLLHNNMNTPYFNKVLKQQTDRHLSEHNLGYLYKTMIETKSSAKYIYETSKTARAKIEYPQNPFGKQLKTTAEFINSGLETKVYYVSMGGFDTHANQINSQARLLDVYSKAMEVFVKDIDEQGNLEDTLILTFSEFGRRVEQNAANGTDHGAANNVFVIGKNLKKPGLYNEAPNLDDLDTNKDLKYSIDFRSVYATILSKWLKVDTKEILNYKGEILDFI